MDFGGPQFILAIIAIVTLGWVLNNWIRARHGYPLEDEWGGKSERLDTGETQRLAQLNDRLSDRLAKMEDRVISLETIITDKGYDVANQIEALRDERGHHRGLERQSSATR